MKGHAHHHHHHQHSLQQQPKRRCRGLAAAVPALVVCSLLLPLLFLLALHRPAGYGPDQRAAAAVVISTVTELDLGARGKRLDGAGGTKHKLLKDGSKKKTSGSSEISYEKPRAPKPKKLPLKSKAKLKGAFSLVGLNNDTIRNNGKQWDPASLFHGGTKERHYQYASYLSMPFQDLIDTKDINRRTCPGDHWIDTDVDDKESHAKEVPHEENHKPCELEYGSYCLWSVEHKEVMKDAIVKRLKDQLFMARAHYPSIAKLKHQEIFTRELKQNIQEHERMLSETITDADLPPSLISNVAAHIFSYAKKLEKMEHAIERARSSEVGCSNVERKLRQLLDITEDEAYFHTRQSAFLYHLGVQTMPKTHHCLNMRLTVEYFKSRSIRMDQLKEQELEHPTFHHYAIFSRNVLSASTTINSTVMNSKDSSIIVFHLFTDTQNFFAMKHWFDRNSYFEATVHVTNIEEHQKLSEDVDSLYIQQLWPTEEFRVTIHDNSDPSQRQMKTEYISIFSQSHFLLPDLLPGLNRVVVLDDDLIVQKDLSSLWDLDMGGKVIGAVQSCGVRLAQLRAYIAEHSFKTNSCLWLSGLNVVELEKWRDLRLTGLFHKLLQTLQKDSQTSQQLKTLPVSLLAFQDLIYPLEDSWVQSGLGHDYKISRTNIETAATLHYNGVMKPWLDLGIHEYRSYWRKYMTSGERFMTECNIH
ncbi:hypothetical protein ACP4OV_014872 [Aristida adscensionis]